MCRRDNARLGIPERRLVTNENKAQELGDNLSKVTDGYVRVSLLLERAFGLRREEAIKIIPAYADRGDRIVLKKSWTKGGRARVIPITTPVQRIVLDAAHKRAGNGSLIPPHRTYVEQLRVYEGQCKTAALRNMHGLLHAYVHERYETLTGWRAPAAGGPSTRELTPLQRMQERTRPSTNQSANSVMSARQNSQASISASNNIGRDGGICES